MQLWLQQHKQIVLLFVIVFLLVVLSFGLGFLAGSETEHAPIIIEKAGESIK
ncbi:MAG: hypothetical protein AAB407_02705 [Patescibacteria group bacterium]